MPSIISYRRIITREVTRELWLLDERDQGPVGTELATVDGVTYVSLPDGVSLPKRQPAEIIASIASVTLTDTLRDAIKAASPHVRMIDARIREAIAERYPVEDEIKLLRTAPSAECIEYNAYAEECRNWGRAQKAKLGL